MTSSRILPLAALFALSLGCDGKPQAPADAKPATPVAESKAKDPAEGKAEAKAMEAKANPHGAGAPAGGPHGGMGMAPKKKEPGPPRDVKPSGEISEETFAEIKVSVPKEWEKGQPSNPMRIAEFVIPGPGGDAELVVYRFKGGAGGVDANIARWKGQFQPPEGKSIDDVTKLGTVEVGDLKATTVDISGRYVAAVRPGAPETVDKPDQRMLAAIVEGSGDPFFFKGTGPDKTLAVWSDAFTAMVKSIKK